MYVIKDSVHGNIRLTDLERSVVDTNEMQRLRGIKQLALTHLVYPGANHTRFEHSLGTLHVTGEICESLGLGEDEKKELRVAALLHDVGHGAFSHESDYFLKKHLGETHESLALRKLRDEGIQKILKTEGLSPERISSLIKGEGLGKIITSGIGADRMDYLLRDSYYTGVAYGIIDSERLIHTMSLSKGGIVLDEGGLEAAESLLIARFMMFSTVYSHHAVRIASAMLRRAIERGIESYAMRAIDLASFDDEGVLRSLASDNRAGRFVRGIENRDLYKRALVCELWKIPKESGGALQRNGNGRKLAGEIASSSDLDEDEVLVDLPFMATKESDDISIAFSGKSEPLSKASELVCSIRASEEKRQRLIVACPQYAIKKVEKAARKALGVQA